MDLDLDVLFENDLKMLAAPCQPVRFEAGIPFYTSHQVDLYGEPHHWGVDQYQIIQLREDAHPFVTDFEMEQDRRGALRPIHHYSRVERFESILYQLIGSRGRVPPEVVQTIRKEGYNQDPEKIWDSIRSILKKHKWRPYYNRIPTILQMLGYQEKIEFGDSNLFVRQLVNDFKRISQRFEELKPTLGRTYFPNLRFIAFKLLEASGANFQYKIPFVRTPRKEKILNEMWKILSSK